MKANPRLSRIAIGSSYNEAATRFSLWDKERKNSCVSLSSSNTRAKIETDDETADRENTSRTD